MDLTSKEVSANRTSAPNLIIKLGARIVRAAQTFHRAAMCSHCGRYHVASLETCLMFDHLSANQSATWPTGKPPLKLETPEAWTAWLETKTKTHPALVEEFKKQSKERKAQGGQGNHGDGGRPPCPQGQRQKGAATMAQPQRRSNIGAAAMAQRQRRRLKTKPIDNGAAAMAQR